MARKVSIRTSYLQDARFLTNLVEAYTKDPDFPLNQEDRKSLVQKLRECASALLTADGQRKDNRG